MIIYQPAPKEADSIPSYHRAVAVSTLSRISLISENANSKSSTVMTRGGPILILLPTPFVNIPRDRSLDASIWADILLGKTASSMKRDQRPPRPWMAETQGELMLARRLEIISPSIKARCGSSSSTTTWIAALAAAQATGLPANVEPCLRR